MKNKYIIIGIIITTVILAGIAIFTAIRLYNTRDVAVAPNVPSSKPAAQEVVNTCSLSFSLTATATSTSTATATTTATSKATGTSTATPAPTTAPTAAQTQQPSLPVVGTSWPTLLGTGFGILVIIGSLLLAF
ncbi:MAG: hypothetical protein AAB559_02080 [Patescibacteria group bacterium]